MSDLPGSVHWNLFVKLCINSVRLEWGLVTVHVGNRVVRSRPVGMLADDD